jgi:hypothetical protein
VQIKAEIGGYLGDEVLFGKIDNTRGRWADPAFHRLSFAKKLPACAINSYTHVTGTLLAKK